MLNVSLTTWFITIGVLVLILGIAARKGPHTIAVGEATKWVLLLGVVADGQSAGEFFAGYLTVLPVGRNLFVFVITMASFQVPAEHQHKVLLFGIVLALVLRGAFIAVTRRSSRPSSGSLSSSAPFYVTSAVRLARHRDEEPEVGNTGCSS